MQFSLLQLFGFVTVCAIVYYGLFHLPIYVLIVCTNAVLCASFAGMPFAAILPGDNYVAAPTEHFRPGEPGS